MNLDLFLRDEMVLGFNVGILIVEFANLMRNRIYTLYTYRICVFVIPDFSIARWRKRYVKIM